MSELTQKIDDVFRDKVKPFEEYLAFAMRDEAGYTPYKIRVTMFVKTEEGDHFTETEQHTDPEKYEEIYQEYISRDVIRQAKDIIDSDKKEG